MTLETTAKVEPVQIFSAPETKQPEIKKQISIQELVESLKSIADDIGQISELGSEERILVTQFFSSLFKLMTPLTPSIAVNQMSLPSQLGGVVQAHVDPTGHLILQFEDGHFELENLSEEKNRELMTAVVSDIVPKFKSLTSGLKRKLENRIKMLSSVTKEIQKSSDALSTAMSGNQ